jgi:hypothetical protein
MKIQSFKFLVILIVLLNGCKEVNVKTEGQSLSEQQVYYLEKRLELLEKKVVKIEEQFNDSLENKLNDSQSNESAVIENVLYKNEF